MGRRIARYPAPQAPHVALEAVVGVVAEELQLLLHRRRAVRLKLHFAPIRGHQHVHHCITAQRRNQGVVWSEILRDFRELFWLFRIGVRVWSGETTSGRRGAGGEGSAGSGAAAG